MKNISVSQIIVVVLLLAATEHTIAESDDTARMDNGARIFVERCVICHGNEGMGDGLLRVAVDDYPDTNLRHVKFAGSLDLIKQFIRDGGIGTISPYSPPWRDELVEADIHDVATFLESLRANPAQALSRLAVVKPPDQAHESGSLLYKTRCALCHGPTGRGDGKMSKIIKSPPPFNLTYSVMPDPYLRDIINRGGEALGRSPQMPPWVDELSDAQVTEIISFIKTFRVTRPQ